MHSFERLRRQFFLTLGPVLALIIFSTPLQLHMPLARYQHYGLAVFAWGLCYILQLIWSYKRILPWTRISYLATGLYLTSAGMLFYLNPWLDAAANLATSSMRIIRVILGLSYALMVFPILIIWYTSYQQERKAFEKSSSQTSKQ